MMKRILTGLFVALLLGLNAVARAQDDATDNAFYKGVVAYRAHKFEEAASWFLQAADAGDGDAQFLLGRMHYDGNSLSVDDVTAWMWFDIAAANGVPVGARYRNGIAARMSDEDIAIAKQRADAWRRAHPSEPR